ncbi:hypothetical protein BH20ACI2_BH20ACI2_07030 [soil metagenome]
MQFDRHRNSPGRIRDAILHVMSHSTTALSVKDLETRVGMIVGQLSSSSIRSYLRLNTPDIFTRVDRGIYRLRDTSDRSHGDTLSDPEEDPASFPTFAYGKSRLIQADCFKWIEHQEPNSIHAVVTDPPYGLHEYTREQQDKLRNGKGGVWRIPPSFDGHKRSPLPRFTTLTLDQLDELQSFFGLLARLLLPKLVPGAHVIIASNPLVSYLVSNALANSGLERRGEIVRLTMTMRGGDRPKAAHEEFSNVSVMPRSRWEPWIVYRKPIEGRVQDNLRKWKTGGFRRPSVDKPFSDVISSAPTRSTERRIAPHPSLKPQSFMRQVVRAALPLGEGLIFDPFAGAGSTLAAAESVGYKSVGTEKDEQYFNVAKDAIPKLARLKIKG